MRHFCLLNNILSMEQHFCSMVIAGISHQEAAGLALEMFPRQNHGSAQPMATGLSSSDTL